MPAGHHDPVPGAAIVWWSWMANAVFALTAVPFAAGVDAFEVPAVTVALVLFGISLPVWGWAFAVAFARSAGGEDLAVASMFVTLGDASGTVRRHLFGALVVCLAVTAGTAVAEPFGTLVPMLPLGLAGLWAARHGSFPPRRR
jgi:hypothetical protein